MKAVVALLALAACTGTDGVVAPKLDRAEPPYAPLAGGTEIILRGSGFAAPNRVFIAGHEAPLVRTIDDTQLGVVIPPGDLPGDVEVVVLNRNGNTAEHGILRYSTPPEISAVSPGRVLYSSDTTRVTVTGSGFLDEAAGTVDVLLDGAFATDIVVVSDTELTFTAPNGRPLARPELTVVDARGTATTRKSFRYVPSEHPGLLLFTPPFTSLFAVFIDPARMEVVAIPLVTNPLYRYTTVVRDAQGEYWALDQAGQFGHVDLTSQTIENPIAIGRRIPTIVRIGDDYFGIDRTTQSVGRFDPTTGGFTPISTPIACCGSFGLAPVGETVYFTARKPNTPPTINTVDLATGEVGTPVTLSGSTGFHVEEMRAFDGRLYATSRDGTFVMIDPATGTVTTLPISPGRANAMEVFE